MNALQPIITTRNLTVGYQSKGEPHILFDSLNLSVCKGQLICFMGPNGIGKSTLIRTLLGTHGPLSGSVSGVTNKTVAVVLTDKVSNSMMTVKDLVAYGRYPYLDWSVKLSDTDRAAIHTAIEHVRIAHLVDERIDRLSDGQLQMVMIAKALARETPALLLDEPTAHLDLNNRVEIMNLLKCFAQKHERAVLVTTHELDLALQTADLIWLAGNQRSIVTGIPEDLVLQGAFDEVFRFKGFDLKSGKVIHDPHRKVSVDITGEGHPYLWTKNALERTGYRVAKNSSIEIEIIASDTIGWKLKKNSHTSVYGTLRELLRGLES